jgi:hypothetical protein
MIGGDRDFTFSVARGMEVDFWTDGSKFYTGFCDGRTRCGPISRLDYPPNRSTNRTAGTDSLRSDELPRFCGSYVCRHCIPLS